MSLDERLLRFALHCAEEELQARRRGKRPGGVRPWNAELLRALQLELSVSHERQEQSERESPYDHDFDWISSQQAADILGWSARTVQRRATDLDGLRLSSRKVVFRASVVHDYAEAMTDARDTA